jgi:hypothetical protein
MNFQLPGRSSQFHQSVPPQFNKVRLGFIGILLWFVGLFHWGAFIYCGLWGFSLWGISLLFSLDLVRVPTEFFVVFSLWGFLLWGLYILWVFYLLWVLGAFGFACGFSSTLRILFVVGISTGSSCRNMADLIRMRTYQDQDTSMDSHNDSYQSSGCS